MQGKSILIVGDRDHVAWLDAFVALGADAGIVDQTVEIVPDVEAAETRLATRGYDIIAVCDPEVLRGGGLERLVELAGARRVQGTWVLAQDASGETAARAALSRRIGLVELRFGRPLGGVVPTGMLPSDVVAPDLWLRSIYRPMYDDPVPLPVHEDAEAAYWAEQRRESAARPPRD